MIDSMTAQKLVFTGQNYNTELRAAIDSISSKPRFLDKAPDKYSSVTRGEEFSPFGVYAKVKRVYEQKYMERENKTSTVMMDDTPIKCEFPVFITLSTLMDMSVSKSEACATACRELFCSILNTSKDGTIAREDVAGVLKECGDYYKNEIIRGLLECIFTGKELVMHRLKDMLGKEYYEGVYEKLGSPEDIDQLESTIKNLYKRVCSDPDYHVKKHRGKAINVVLYLKCHEG